MENLFERFYLFLYVMRNRLIHDYIGVNYSIVWDVVKNKIPQLFIQMEELLSRDESKKA
jgi:uncharacterized protein with HEPN domain